MGDGENGFGKAMRIRRMDVALHHVISHQPVDNIGGKRFFLDVLNGLAACGHMSGLFARKPCPLALMKSDCEGPYQCCGLYTRGTEQGVLRRRCRPVVHHVEVSPSPNSLSLGLLPRVTVTSPAPYAGSNMSLRNVSPSSWPR